MGTRVRKGEIKNYRQESGYKRVKVHNEIRSKNLRVHKGGKTVQEMKNQLLIKKGESDWNQTYLLRKLENGGVYVIQQEKKGGG